MLESLIVCTAAILTIVDLSDVKKVQETLAEEDETCMESVEKVFFALIVRDVQDVHMIHSYAGRI